MKPNKKFIAGFSDNTPYYYLIAFIILFALCFWQLSKLTASESNECFINTYNTQLCEVTH